MVATRRAGLEFVALTVGVLAIALGSIFLLADEPLARLAEHWFLTPIAVAAAGFASATAIGGGFLFLPFFILVYGLAAHESLKLALATQAFGMTSGALGWSRRLIVGRALLVAAAASGVGMVVGTFVWRIDGLAIKSIFGWASIAAGVVLYCEMRFGRGQRETEMRPGSLRAAGYLLACLAGGLINAWISIGIGEVVALYLLFVYRVRIDYAVATGVAALAFDSLLGLAFHAGLGGIRWDLLAFAAPGVVLGGRLGAQLGRRAEERSRSQEGGASPLKWIFIVIVVLDGIVMLAHAYSAH